VRSLIAAAFLLTAAIPVVVPTVVGQGSSPAVPLACEDGETGVTNGCARFCLPHLEMDLRSGLCVPPKQAPPVDNVH
jgi:hypothetical protein